MEEEQLLKEMKSILLNEIPKAVKSIRLESGEMVCYISLLGTDYEPVLGYITLGIESHRKEIIEEYGIEDKYSIWNSGNMPINYQTTIEDSTFRAHQDQLAELLRGDRWEEIWAACQALRFEIAMELNSYNWGEFLPVTEDFVVFSEWEAIDVENGDLVPSIPQEKMNVLVEKGLVNEREND
ncbi:hypothetical protein A8F94_08900 [Bacillus sp. FJAT-27225]|uniref:hypothetical protein n=1 Tax=Bacillus sp. FJAT-27225 TaxID=1743144 RepID=UPI00080C33EA|nr:hypothetical protein [Bacillus sp. FJAT-27225]OCA87936.1 hypothetical protein A8F94_08900 [Bacillus sp. FJAT-27225]